MDVYYDELKSKNYIITGTKGYVKSYDFNKNEVYYKYCDNDNKGHGSIIINKNENIIQLIESSWDGNIRIWNFHTGLLLNKIKGNNGRLYGMCLWNSDFLFVGCKDKTIKLIDIQKRIIINNYIFHGREVISLKKIYFPQYGECLISQGRGNDQIKLWINPN